MNSPDALDFTIGLSSKVGMIHFDTVFVFNEWTNSRFLLYVDAIRTETTQTCRFVQRSAAST